MFGPGNILFGLMLYFREVQFFNHRCHLQQHPPVSSAYVHKTLNLFQNPQLLDQLNPIRFYFRHFISATSYWPTLLPLSPQGRYQNNLPVFPQLFYVSIYLVLVSPYSFVLFLLFLRLFLLMFSICTTNRLFFFLIHQAFIMSLCYFGLPKAL